MDEDVFDSGRELFDYGLDGFRVDFSPRGENPGGCGFAGEGGGGEQQD